MSLNTLTVSIIDSVGTQRGALANNATTDDSRPALTGQGTPGTSVNIYLDNSFIGSTVVDPNGYWLFYPSWWLTAGTYSFRVENGSNPSVTQNLTLQLQYPLAPETPSYPGHTAGEVRNSGAFAALKSDGTVITWGLSSSGGDSSAVASALTGVVQVFSNNSAFAALKSDGTVITWGDPYNGGDSSAVASALTGVVQVFSTIYAFAALKSDGTVITWGDSGNGGDSSAVAGQLTGVVQVFSTNFAFAALKNDGTLITWGSSTFGGNSSAVASSLTGVVQVFSTNSAFAALKSDGTVVTWGDSSNGGDSSAVASALTGVVQVFSTNSAFAALKNDGTVITWVDSSPGGDSSTVASALTGVVQVFSTIYAFAALKSDGTVVTWGDPNWGGDSSAVAGQLTGVVQVFSTDSAFAALKSDGSVITWGGDSSYGGDSSAVASQLTSGVVSLSDIYSNQNLSLTDTTPPTLEPQNSNPADNATTVAVSSDLEVTFSEAIAFGSAGSITLYNVTTGSVAETFDVSTASQGVVTGSQGGSLTLSGSRLTLNPNGNLNSNTQYSLHFTAGSVTDTATTPNPLAAITDNTTYNFTTLTSSALTLSIIDSVGAQRGALANNATTDDSRPALTGQGTPVPKSIFIKIILLLVRRSSTLMAIGCFTPVG